MNWFVNLKIAQKLGLSFGLCIFVSLIAGIAATDKMSHMNVQTGVITHQSIPQLTLLAAINSDALSYRVRQSRGILSDGSQKAQIAELERQSAESASKDIEAYKKGAINPDDKANIDKLSDKWKTYLAWQDKFQDAEANQSIKVAGKLLNGPMYLNFQEISEQIATMTAWNQDNTSALSKEADASYASGRILIIILLLIATVIGITMSVIVTKMISKPIDDISARMSTMKSICITNLAGAIDNLAQGKLDSKIVTGTEPLDYNAKDELGDLSHSINDIIGKIKGTISSFERAQTSLKEMIESTHNTVISAIVNLDKSALMPLCDGMTALSHGDFTKAVSAHVEKMNVEGGGEFAKLGIAFNEVAGRVENALEEYNSSIQSLSQVIDQTRSSAETIAGTSSELASNTQDLADRTSEQASSLEETASSMEEMTSTVRLNADNSKHANDLAKHAREVASAGGEVVASAVGAMDAINTSSKRIADIISVIDEIAFQTNLLALNAAVEAARVGEQGKGFAVVASEVRSLAARSSTAAKEIKSLVQDSVTKVEEGAELVNKSGVQLDEIVNSVNKVAEIIAEITAASQEQSTGIEQVNQAVNQLDQITQQNAASVEELAATSQAMSDQAQDLQSVVKQFKTNATNVSHLRMVTSENPAPIARRPEKVAVGQNASKMPAAPSKKKPSSPPRALQSSETLEF